MGKSNTTNTHSGFKKDGSKISTSSLISPTTTRIYEADLRFKRNFINNDVDHTKNAKQLVKDGIWLVPVTERPKGWERMGLKEQ